MALDTWKQYVGIMEWHDLCPEYPGWELDNAKPLFVDLTIVKGEDKDSYKIACEWDDIAQGPFYWRDWTDSGLPFVSEGETYTSVFWFALREDLEEFKRLYPC